MTIASLLSKAFVATAVPDTLCAGEAWHILWDLRRTVHSRQCMPFNLDATTALMDPAEAVNDKGELRKSMKKVPLVERYRDRMHSEIPEGKMDFVQNANLFTFASHCFVHGHTGQIQFHQVAKVVVVKPYLNLDLRRPKAAEMCRYALRLARPWEDAGGDPINLADETAISEWEQFVRLTTCPRWLRDRHRKQNRQRRANNPSVNSVREPADDEAGPEGQDTEPGLSFLQSARISAREHELQWDGNPQGYQETVVESMRTYRGPKPPALCVNGLLEMLDPELHTSMKKAPINFKRQALVSVLLRIDLLKYIAVGKGFAKPGLSTKDLREAVRFYGQTHPTPKTDEQKTVIAATKQPYAVLWNSLKRAILVEHGLNVMLAPSKRVYFNEPISRPHEQHVLEKKAEWRQPVAIISPYGREDEDEDHLASKRRKRSYVSTATNEQSMGRGGEPDLEVPVPEDDDALESVDTAAKVEWDTLHPFSHLLQNHDVSDSWIARIENGQETNVPVATALHWTTPERLQGPKRNERATAVTLHPQLSTSEREVNLEDLDPTQRFAADIAVKWADAWMEDSEYERQGLPPKPLNMVWLGTAGTGKTETLKACLRHWETTGFGKVRIAAFTGVAASNVGQGATTLHSLFRLHDVNSASGELNPMQGKALEEFIEELDGCRLLVIDEISMVSKTVLAQISTRLQEWRVAENLPGSDLPFGGSCIQPICKSLTCFAFSTMNSKELP